MIKVLRKAFNILEILSSSDEAISLAQIAEKSDIPPSTCAGIIKDLCETGYVEKDATRGYRLGRAAMKLTSKAVFNPEHSKIFEEILPNLYEIYKQQTVITVFSNLVRYTVAAIDEKGRYLTECTADAGAIESATGLVLLASLPSYKREYFLSFYNLPNKFRSIQEFQDYLDNIAEEGYALHSSNERNAIAVPIKDENGNVLYALGVSFKNLPIEEGALEKLRITANEIEEKIERCCK